MGGRAVDRPAGARLVCLNGRGGTIDVTGTRSDGLALDAPYPVGITRVDWLVDEPECPNDALVLRQWVLVRAGGCPDCNGNGVADDCLVHNLTQDAVFLTIQGAVDTAADGDEIVVGPGTFNETVDLLGKALLLRSSEGPEATIIDIGAMPRSVVTCANGEGPDTVLDGDAAVGITDLLALLGAWGPCPSPPESCPADFEHDGEVGVVDFLMLLADWG